MTAFTIVLITLAVLLLGGLAFMLIYTYPISKRVYDYYPPCSRYLINVVTG